MMIGNPCGQHIGPKGFPESSICRMTRMYLLQLLDDDESRHWCPRIGRPRYGTTTLLWIPRAPVLRCRWRSQPFKPYEDILDLRAKGIQKEGTLHLVLMDSSAQKKLEASRKGAALGFFQQLCKQIRPLERGEGPGGDPLVWLPPSWGVGYNP